jgi:hypothetical protein
MVNSRIKVPRKKDYSFITPEICLFWLNVVKPACKFRATCGSSYCDHKENVDNFKSKHKNHCNCKICPILYGKWVVSKTLGKEI